MTVTTDDDTSVTETTDAEVGDLATGDEITVIGEKDDDGNVAADSISQGGRVHDGRADQPRPSPTRSSRSRTGLVPNQGTPVAGGAAEPHPPLLQRGFLDFGTAPRILGGFIGETDAAPTLRGRAWRRRGCPEPRPRGRRKVPLMTDDKTPGNIGHRTDRAAARGRTPNRPCRCRIRDRPPHPLPPHPSRPRRAARPREVAVARADPRARRRRRAAARRHPRRGGRLRGRHHRGGDRGPVVEFRMPGRPAERRRPPGPQDAPSAPDGHVRARRHRVGHDHRTRRRRADPRALERRHRDPDASPTTPPSSRRTSRASTLSRPATRSRSSSRGNGDGTPEARLIRTGDADLSSLGGAPGR